MKNYVDELTLLLLYVTSFKEKCDSYESLRRWKGYPFETLDVLTENDLIDTNNRSKSVYLTEKGIEQAKNLIKKYNIQHQ